MKGDSFTSLIQRITRYILMSLVVIMTLALLLGIVNLVITLGGSLIDRPYLFSLDVKELYVVFKLVLIIVIGYELIKSLLVILNSHYIPAKTIVNIAIIAVANKIITLDMAQTGWQEILALAALLLALGVTNHYTPRMQVDEPDGAN